jgi:hypothetical protein
VTLVTMELIAAISQVSQGWDFEDALDGHDVRSRLASMPLYGQSSGSPRGFMH